MTDEEITQLAQKIKDGLASEEEKPSFSKSLILSSIHLTEIWRKYRKANKL